MPSLPLSRRSTSMTTQRVAVIGLGSMGFGMAQSLLRAGFTVTGCDVDQATVARFIAAGGHGAATPAEAAKDAAIAISVVVTAAQTESILLDRKSTRLNSSHL